jgi:hypothetical protein
VVVLMPGLPPIFCGFKFLVIALTKGKAYTSDSLDEEGREGSARRLFFLFSEVGYDWSLFFTRRLRCFSRSSRYSVSGEIAG